MNPVTSTGWEKIPWNMLLSFSKMKVLLWHQDQVIHRYENLHWKTHGLLNTRPYMSHLKVKLRGQFFKRTQESKRTEICIMCYLDCVFSYFSSQKAMSNPFQNKILKILKWNHLLLYIKKKSRKLCLFLKAKSEILIKSCTLFA